MALSYVEDLRAKRLALMDELAAFETGQLHIGNPWENRTEARMHDIRRKIAVYDQLLEKHDA